MTRIAFVIGQLGLGGAEKQLCQLAAGLKERDYHPLVISLREGGEREKELRAHGVETAVLSRRRSYDIGRLLHAVKILRDFKPEIVHGFDYGGAVYGSLAGTIARVPIIIGGIRNAGTPPKKVIYAERILRSRTDAFISNSIAGKQHWVQLTGCPEEKVIVIPNGFKFEEMGHTPSDSGALYELLRIPRGTPIIGCIATMCERKNPLMFIEVATALIASGIKAHFVWIGDGPMLPHIQRVVADRKFEGLIHLPGSRGDAPSLARDFQIGVLTSLDEGLPNAIMEYMYWGIPVVATDAGGCRELIEHEQSGFIVRKGDVATMTGHLSRLITDQTSARAMGNRGRELLRKLSAETMIHKSIAFYEEMRMKKSGVTSSSETG